MIELKIDEPNAKQKIALADRHRYVCFGGARGGGKSWFVRVKSILLALNYPGIKILIIRRTYPELIANHIVPLREMLIGIASYNKTDKIFTFPNGSTISFGYCSRDEHLDRYQGNEMDVLFLDEATQLKEEWFQKLDACVRGVNNFPKRTYLTANPGGVGHAFVQRLFVDRKFNDTENPDDYSFTQSLVTDNVALMKSMPSYIKALDNLPPKLRDAWRYGRWDIFQGQFFSLTDDPEHYKDRRNTHVIEPFEIPSHWTIYRSFDFGYAKPFSVGWWAVDEENVVYRILELYGCTDTPNEGVKWTPDEIFKKIKEIETQHRWLKGKTIHGVADPAIWEASTGESIAERGEKYGIYFEKGDNKRIAGWMQVQYRLQFDDNGFPMMYIFNNCKAFIRTIPLLVYDEHKVEDLDTTMEDHVADETRYFCQARPLKAAPIKTKQKLGDDPLNINEYHIGAPEPIAPIKYEEIY